jgi:peptidoglycan/LPS O-acetylase OafA/YrhL
MTSSLGKNLRWVGLVSYSLYLLHEPFIEMVGYLATPRLRQSPLELFPICFAEWPFILLIAWAFYRIIELPSIAWGKRIIVRSGRGEPPQARLSLQ